MIMGWQYTTSAFFKNILISVESPSQQMYIRFFLFNNFNVSTTFTGRCKLKLFIFVI